MPSLLEQLLAEQSDLTAVERFACAHDEGDVPEQSRYYERLLPASQPKDGQQFAFKVDLDRCSGCKACVTACHSLNGLDENETWRDVGLLIGGDDLLPVMQHVTTACHHCLEPACATGCPVNAYEKDPVTGIVKHLDDQCFGCQYCTMSCPYDVPKYHAEKGIVRKCDMCSDRLAVGEAPACVQACPHEAIAIQLVDVEQVRHRDQDVVATSPSSSITHPTTTYESERPHVVSNALTSPVQPQPQHAHWPLIVMLLLSQMSVGAFGCVSIFALMDGVADVAPILSLIALGVGLASIAAATLHLGRPQYAFRAILGVTHSWLSREIVVFGVFAGAAITVTAVSWLQKDSPLLLTLSLTTTGAGLGGVWCSVMIYVFTRRDFWQLRATATRFFGSAVVLGVPLVAVVLAVQLQSMGLDRIQLSGDGLVELVSLCWPGLFGAVTIAMLIKLIAESALCRDAQVSRQLKRSRQLMTGRLKKLTVSRFAGGVVGGILLPAAIAFQDPVDVSLVWPMAVLLVCLLAETCERYLFFAAVSPDRMPQGLHS